MRTWFSLSLRQTGDRRIRENSTSQTEEDSKCPVMEDSYKTVDLEMKSQDNISLQVYGHREALKSQNYSFVVIGSEIMYWLKK